MKKLTTRLWSTVMANYNMHTLTLRAEAGFFNASTLHNILSYDHAGQASFLYFSLVSSAHAHYCFSSVSTHGYSTYGGGGARADGSLTFDRARIY